MPFDFDPNASDVDVMDGFDDADGQLVSESAYDNAPVPGAPSSYIPDAAVEKLLTPDPEEDYEQVLSQVDRRMRVAHFYRSILDAELFSEKTSEAKLVQNRIRKFCNDELEVIFGMRAKLAQPSLAGQFSADEVKVLKELITRLTLAGGAKTKPPQPKPTVNQVQPKPASAVQTIQTQSKPAVVVPPQSSQRPVSKPPANAGVDLRIPERYRNDPTAQVSKGKVFVQQRNDEGELVWMQRKAANGKITKHPVMRDVTPIAQPIGAPIQPIPMPSMLGGAGSPFSQVMQQHADNTLAALDRAGSMPGVGGRIARNLGHGLLVSLTKEDDEYER